MLLDACDYHISFIAHSLQNNMINTPSYSKYQYICVINLSKLDQSDRRDAFFDNDQLWTKYPEGYTFPK